MSFSFRLLVLFGAILTVVTAHYVWAPYRSRMLRTLHGWWLPELYYFHSREQQIQALKEVRKRGRCGSTASLLMIFSTCLGLASNVSLASNMLMFLCCIGLLWSWTWPSRDVLRELLAAAQICMACGYDLTGNVSGRCSECGKVMEKYESTP